MGFGIILRTLRTTAGLSLRELARDLEVSPTYLSLIETGKSPPPVEDKILRIEDRLGVPPGSLLSFTGRHPRRVIELLHENEQAAHFFQTAMDQKLLPEDFELLTRLLMKGGRPALAKALDQAWEESLLTDPLAKSTSSPLLGRNFLFESVEAKNWKQLVHKISAFISERYPKVQSKVVAEALIEREKTGSTAIGDGLAVPHAILENLAERIVALIRIPDGIDLGAPDKVPVTLAFCILGPEKSRAYHVYLLARIARFFLQPGLHARLLSAKDEKEILEILNEMDDKIP
ncbi:MAG: PTS sugar transporter subunit IIA [Planctomycetes bacterium]|nr:PTS sugar transporter subunit IIA [Planctomycetota bacterium]